MKKTQADHGDRLKVQELTDYYVEKYGLKTEGVADNTYVTEMTRILKNTKVAGKRLWDIIKSDEKGPRRISLEEFEKNCLSAWEAYAAGHGRRDGRGETEIRDEIKKIKDTNTSKEQLKKNGLFYVSDIILSDNLTDEEAGQFLWLLRKAQGRLAQTDARTDLAQRQKQNNEP